MSRHPLVSVVIPVRDRPIELRRALRSVLAQTCNDIEVRIIDDASLQPIDSALGSEFLDERVIVSRLNSPFGAARARNVGVNQSRGRFVAFLDSDDEWYPNKLAAQLRHIAMAPTGVISYHRILVDDGGPERPRPVRAIARGEDVAEYLFVAGCNIQTSTLLAPREVWLQVPFRDGLAKHQDWDIAIRAQAAKIQLDCCGETLAVYHGRAKLGRISNDSDYDYSIAWAQSVGRLSRRAEACFWLRVVVPQIRSRHGFCRASGTFVKYVAAARLGAASLCRLFVRACLPGIYSHCCQVARRLSPVRPPCESLKKGHE
ncbi:glycosyltransferase family 2 protein [Opitutus terrae]|uniref:Glycosyl transferase family 2 n=1 Tax=Opitutus terrae (strain DSM 11246 / JCM 15787 / PB90-1) TaxID=452637 RepID=B1ZV65_OPITP|nr:glycosyl transferase family 2 [Opitutus terrae PB90-1]